MVKRFFEGLLNICLSSWSEWFNEWFKECLSDGKRSEDSLFQSKC